MTIIRRLYAAAFWPARIDGHTGIFRQLLLRPRLFDIASWLLQARDSRRIRHISGQQAFEDPYLRRVHDYNAGVTAGKVISTTRRMERCYRVVSMPPRDLKDERLLIVGPRNIQELFIAWLYGFKWESITGIDLYSTNPKIRVMDMENMEYEDGSFDAVVMAHTLALAKDVQKCIAEVSRVLTEGGRFVFDATYFPDSDEYPGLRVTGSQVRGYCSEAQLEPYYYECSDKINALGGKQASHLFGVRKSSSNEPFDPIGW